MDTVNVTIEKGSWQDIITLGSLSFDAEVNSGAFKEIAISHAESYDSLAKKYTDLESRILELETKPTSNITSNFTGNTFNNTKKEAENESKFTI